MRERAELSRVPMSNLFRLNRGGGVFSLRRKFHQGLGAISFSLPSELFTISCACSGLYWSNRGQRVSGNQAELVYQA